MSFLRAFGMYVPKQVMDNAELALLLDVTSEWIHDACGIQQRRYAAAEETVVTLAINAAKDCLANAGLTTADVGMLIVAGGSADRFCPGPAASVAAGLELRSALALDVPVASAGSLIALVIAAKFAPSVGRVLVVASEIMSRRVDRTPEGKNTAILFGDGAGAVLVDANKGFLEITDIHLETDGTQSEILRMESSRLHMEGGSVILQASRKIPASIKSLLERNKLAAKDIDAVLMHQANRNLIAKVARSVDVPLERFFINIERYGNTSAASMLIASAEWRAAQPDTPTGITLFAAFGTGLNWGAILAIPAPDKV